MGENNNGKIELTLDTEFAPKYSTETLGEKEEEFNFLIVKYIAGEDISISLVKEDQENINRLDKLMDEGFPVYVLGRGTAKHTNITELIYGLNHPTRVLYRSAVNDISSAFTEGDDLFRKSLKESMEEI